jgi:hypothetical protein
MSEDNQICDIPERLSLPGGGQFLRQNIFFKYKTTYCILTNVRVLYIYIYIYIHIYI